MPIGARISGDPDRIRQAAQAGIRDVVVELPASGSGWKEAFEALEVAGMRYIVAINSMPPMAAGIAVEPQSYRVNDITGPMTVDLAFPDAVSIYAVLASKRDSSVAWEKKLDALSGKLTLKVDPPTDLGYTLVLYPEYTGRNLPDYWDSFSAYRDSLLIALRKSPPGKGLRGILNPMGNLAALDAARSGFVPTSTQFRADLKTALEEKYRSIQSAVKLWSIAASDIENWDQMARLVPLWSGARGVPELYDPTTGRVYLSDARHSTAWSDIQDTIVRAERQRQAKLVDTLRTVAGVPVIQEWRGWSDLYEGSTISVDGIGMRATGGTFSELAESGSPAISSGLRSSKPSWMPATDIDIPKESYTNALQDLQDIGARGWFFRSSGPAQDKLIASLPQASQTLASDSPRAIFFPESAMNPAAPQRLQGGYWWLPSPAAGNRVQLGAGFSCFRYEDGSQSYFEIWQDGAPTRTKLRMAEPKKAVIKSLTGEDLKIKVAKNGIELNVGNEPIMISGIDEIPIPEQAFAEVVNEINTILDGTERIMLGPGTEYDALHDSERSFQRSPGGAFTQLLTQLRSLRQQFSTYFWQEGEATRKASFSESSMISGCSGGAALSLHAVMPNTSYYADYDIPLRSRQDQEVWIAAKIPKGEEKGWTVDVSGQVLRITGPGMSGYGNGFAWYKLGTTRLLNQRNKVRVSVAATQGTEEALDALLFFPGTFTPSGQLMPAVILPKIAKPKEKI